MTAMRSPSRIASAGACVTIRQVARVSRSSCSVSSCMRSRSCTSRPENGSSISITAGRGSDRARQRHPLLLAAREDVRIVVGVALEADAGQRRQRLAGRILPRQRLQPEGDVVADGQMRKQREVLEHQADVALLGRHEAVRARHLEVVDQHPAGRRLLDARRRRAAAWSCRCPTDPAGTPPQPARYRARTRSARTEAADRRSTRSNVSRAAMVAAARPPRQRAYAIGSGDGRCA